MKITNLGIILRDIRIEKKELLYDMAANINVSSAHLSQIEQGIKKLSWKQFYVLTDKYKNYLNDDIIHKIYCSIEKDKSKQFNSLFGQCIQVFQSFGFKGTVQYIYYNGWKLNVYNDSFSGSWCIDKNNVRYKTWDQVLANYNNLVWFKKPGEMCSYINNNYKSEKEIFKEGVFVG